MPVELYIKLSNVFIDYYRNHKNLSADLACDLMAALIPICKKIEQGKYDIKDKK